MRTVLVHLNAEVPDTDTRTADEIGEDFLAAIIATPSFWTTKTVIALAEEI